MCLKISIKSILGKISFWASPVFIVNFYLNSEIKKMIEKYKFHGDIIDIGCGQKPYNKYLRYSKTGRGPFYLQSFSGLKVNKSSIDQIRSVKPAAINGDVGFLVVAQLMETYWLCLSYCENNNIL